jgi:sodium-dependent dicarboxylate transporter 2/3/5
VVPGPAGAGGDARQRYGAGLFWLYMGYFVLEAVARENLSGFAAVSPVVSLGFAALFLYLLFVRRAPDGGGRSGPLLSVKGLLKTVPRRGLVFILVLAGLVGVVHWTGLDHRTVVLAGELLKGDMDPRLLFLLTILAVIFLTEVLSNTAVVAAFFTVAFYAARGHSMDPLPLMIAVGVASTCAFMTPIATTSNALAFGEMRGASLKTMLGLGFVLNVLGALLMAGWLSWALPRLY